MRSVQAVRKRTLVFTSLLLGVAGCADLDQSPVAPAAEPQSIVTMDQAYDGAAIEELTRLLALALSDPSLRERVKNDLRASRFTSEHKLPFTRYLHERTSRPLLTAMHRMSDPSESQIVALLGRLPPLEFYMPVQRHRETWTGGDDLVVAGMIDKAGATLVSYNLAGERVSLSLAHEPETPTLVLVPVETDFATPLPAQQFFNANDRDGRSIGTYVPVASLKAKMLGGVRGLSDCEMPHSYPDAPGTIKPECSGGGYVDPCPRGLGSVQRRGISVQEYIYCIRALNDHEPWPLGNPEFYLLVAGKFSNGTDFQNRINIPEHIWNGSDDQLNARWRAIPNYLSLIVWDTDLGTRLSVQCFESDVAWNATFRVSGTSQYPPANFQLTYGVDFSIGAGDDNCGSSFINLQNTLGQFYRIPDGLGTPPLIDGTSDLQWWGYGVQRP